MAFREQVRLETRSTCINVCKNKQYYIGAGVITRSKPIYLYEGPKMNHRVYIRTGIRLPVMSCRKQKVPGRQLRRGTCLLILPILRYPNSQNWGPGAHCLCLHVGRQLLSMSLKNPFCWLLLGSAENPGCCCSGGLCPSVVPSLVLPDISDRGLSTMSESV